MVASEDHERSWETQADVDACLQETGVTRDQVNRWRQEGLLPPVEQMPQAYRGSAVLYPVGTCAQIRAAKKLFETKSRVDFVGWELWWRGLPVDECHWRPRLERVAETGDRLLRLLKRFMKRDEQEASDRTRVERIAEKQPKQSILAKINRRVGMANLPAMWSIVLPTAAGAFNSNLDPSDEKALTNAFDVSQSQRDRILGHQLRLESALPEILSELSNLSGRIALSEACKFPDSELRTARNDIRNTISIIDDFYEAASWVYGVEAFGLRLAAWVARKSTPDLKALCVLTFAARRREPNSMYSSEQISELARTAAQARENFAALRDLQRDPRFAKVLSPKRLRRGLQTVDEQWNLLKEIEAAKLKSDTTYSHRG
jgi:hypothetical protein